MLGPGEGDVQVTQILTPVLCLAGRIMPLVHGVAGLPADVEFAPVTVVRVVKNDRPASVNADGGVPQERAVNNRELQALGPVDGKDLHGIGVRVEPAGVLFRVGHLRAGLAHTAGQPGPQGGQAKLGFGGLSVEELGHMAKVR